MKRRAATQWGTRCTPGGIAAAGLVPAATQMAMVPARGWLARHDLGSAGEPRLETARDASRGRLLALGAGLLAATALAFTARNVARSRQRRATGRCATAVEQLGSEDLDVRTGGIHALERVARDSPADHAALMETLAAFIREHSHPQGPPPGPASQVRERPLRPDVQAAMTALGRRLAERDTRPIDLTRADLAGADLTGANLADTDLTRADLTCTDLTRAELTGALWPQGRPVPAGWTRHTGSGQLIPADADAEKTAAHQPHR
jgi:hypothetical protein